MILSRRMLGWTRKNVPRPEMRETLATLLQFFGEAPMEPSAPKRRRGD